MAHRLAQQGPIPAQPSRPDSFPVTSLFQPKQGLHGAGGQGHRWPNSGRPNRRWPGQSRPLSLSNFSPHSLFFSHDPLWLGLVLAARPAKFGVARPLVAGPEPVAAKFGAARPPVAGPESAAARRPSISLSLYLQFPLSFLLSLSRSATARRRAGGMAGLHGRPDLHRTHARRRWRSPTKAQAWRGGEHAAEPESKSAQEKNVVSPPRSASSLSLPLTLSLLPWHGQRNLPGAGARTRMMGIERLLLPLRATQTPQIKGFGILVVTG